MHTLSNDRILYKANLTEGLVELPSLPESVTQYRDVLCTDGNNRIALIITLRMLLVQVRMLPSSSSPTPGLQKIEPMMPAKEKSSLVQ